MNVQKKKFFYSALPNPVEMESSNCRIYIWFSVIILFGILFSQIFYFYFKAFSVSNETSESQTITTIKTSDILTTKRQINLFTISYAFPKNIIKVSRHHSEYFNAICGKINDQLVAIPVNNALKKIMEFGIKDVYDLINIIVILYYEDIINEYDSQYLKFVFNDYKHKLSSIKSPNEFMKFVEFLMLRKLEFYKTFFNFEIHHLEIKRFSDLFFITDELNNWYNYLYNLRNFLSLYNQQKLKKNYFRNITKENFFQFIKESQEKFKVKSTFNVTQKKLAEVNEVLTEWMSPMKTEIENSTIVFYAKVILISEIEEKLSLYNISFENINIFASHTVYLDVNLELPGINLAIIAPNWIFMRKVNVNLSGFNGEDHLAKIAEEGKPGRPGNPGGSGGHFWGIGDINRKFLTVLSNGGRGGCGQNGSGGRNGVDYSRPIFTEKPMCLEKINTYTNPSKQKLTHYKVFYESACGTAGFDGGVGGQGGPGGRIVLLTKHSNLILAEGLPGVNGFPGKGGDGGRGGQHSCYYEIIDVDDEVFHYITTIKCEKNYTSPSGKPGEDNKNMEDQVLPKIRQNFSFWDIVIKFIHFGGKDFLKYNDSVIYNFLEDIYQYDSSGFIWNSTNSNSFISLFKVLEDLDNIELYTLLKNLVDRYVSQKKIKNPHLTYLKAIILKKILILKRNVDYTFLDFDNYLNGLQNNIELIENNLNLPIPTSYLAKRVDIKLEKIATNFKQLRSKFLVLYKNNTQLAEKFFNKFLEENNMKEDLLHNLKNVLLERRIIHIMLTTVEIMYAFVNLSQNQSLNNEKRIEFQNFVTRHMVSFDKVERNKKNFFDTKSEFTVSQKEAFSQMTSSVGEYKEYEEVFVALSDLFLNIRNEENSLFQSLKLFCKSSEVQKDRQTLELIYKSIQSFESNLLGNEAKTLLRSLISELEHFSSLFYFIEWYEYEQMFLEIIKNLKLLNDSTIPNDSLEYLSHKLREVMILHQYKLAVDGTQQRIYPIIKLDWHLQIFHEKSIANEAITQISNLKEMCLRSIACKNIHEAIFDKTTTIGEFYFWPNSEIREKLKDLFMGLEIDLTSDLFNRHVLSKNFLKFKSIRLDFACKENSNDNSNSTYKNTLLKEILNNFKIEITHSGYSYYNWNGKTYITISDEITLIYSFKIGKDGLPEVYNSVFKVVKDGDIMLSPFTTWRFRLLPYNNAANLEKLLDFVDEVDLKLVGKGIFFS